jgi:zinc protease
MNYAKKVKVYNLTSGGRLVYTPFASKDMISLVGSVAGGRLGAQGFLETSKIKGSGDVLADLHAAMLLEGTSKHSKKEIQAILDAIGVSLSFTAAADRLVFQASVRPVHLDALLKVISEVLVDATFPESELALLKKHTMSDLSLEQVDPKAQSRIHLSRALFPQGHASREDLSEESMKYVGLCSRTVVRDYHTSSIARSSLIVSIAGDISFTEAQKKITALFKSLPEVATTPIEYVAAPATKGTLIKTPIPEKSSVEYALGIATGMYDSHPDYQALMLGIQILGIPGFTGRLMNIVREQEGLTYGVYASLSGSTRIDGACLIKASFAPELYEKGRASILREIKRLTEKGVTSIEVRKHIAMYKSRSLVALSNSGACAGLAHRLISEGHTPRYFEDFLNRYSKLKAHDVNKALKKYLRIDALAESAAGALSK